MVRGRGRAMTTGPRVGPFREGAFESPLHDVRVAAILGVSLGVAFLVCTVTGFLSHLIQSQPGWFDWPARPAWLYRVTQGVHVTAGIASVPLLLAKLWTVAPRLWRWPPIEGLSHAIERAALVPLVGGSLFLLVTGVSSIARWFPWPFSFPSAHYAATWIALGGLVIHVTAKAATTWLVLARRRPRRPAEPEDDGGLTRRGFLAASFGAAAALVATTVGQTLRPLAPLAVLAPRDPRVGPQGLPVNKTAASAGVTELAVDPAFRLVVAGDVATPLSLSLDDLRRMPMREADLAIACVDGWSASARWRGVPLRDVLAAAGAPATASARVASIQPRGPYREADVSPGHVADADTLLALELNGEPLALDHGFPVRLIGPNRPGVLCTKWVGRVEVTA
jgi:DMSO/TMAO reductase YedYZ molybdopterin-dependent catalytic subunit